MTRADWTAPKDGPKQARWFDPRRAQGRKQTAQVRESGYGAKGAKRAKGAKAAKAVKLVLRSFLLLEEHSSHDVNLRALCVIHIGGEVEQDGILAGSRRVEQILHHHQGTRVVLNHAGQKQAIERRAGGPFQGFHLLWTQHTRHQWH